MSRHLRAELAGEIEPVVLMTAITRQGVVFPWSVPLPDENGRRDTWWETSLEAAELAKRIQREFPATPESIRGLAWRAVLTV